MIGLAMAVGCVAKMQHEKTKAEYEMYKNICILVRIPYVTLPDFMAAQKWKASL